MKSSVPFRSSPLQSSIPKERSLSYAAPPTPQPQASRAAFTFILVTVLLDFLAFGIIAPVLPNLIIQFEGGNIARAAAITGYFGFAWALMQFIFSPILGAWSDRFGRRPVILISCFGLGLDYIFMALAPSLKWLLVGRIISGITASNISSAFAYVTDVTPPEKRAKQFGYLAASFGMGFIIGPAVGGFLGNINLRFPFWAAAALSLANALYGFFVLPEFLRPPRQICVAHGQSARLPHTASLAPSTGGSRHRNDSLLPRPAIPSCRLRPLHAISLRVDRARRRPRSCRSGHQHRHRLRHASRPLRPPFRRTPQRPCRPDLWHPRLFQFRVRPTRLDVSLCHPFPRPLGHRRPLRAVANVSSGRPDFSRQAPRGHQQYPLHQRHDRPAPIHPSPRHRHLAERPNPLPRRPLLPRRPPPHLQPPPRRLRHSPLGRARDS